MKDILWGVSYGLALLLTYFVVAPWIVWALREVEEDYMNYMQWVERILR